MLKQHGEDLSAAEGELSGARRRHRERRPPIGPTAAGRCEQAPGRAQGAWPQARREHRQRSGYAAKRDRPPRPGRDRRRSDAQDRAGRGRPRAQGPALSRRSAVHVSVGSRLTAPRATAPTTSSAISTAWWRALVGFAEARPNFAMLERNSAAAARACRAAGANRPGRRDEVDPLEKRGHRCGRRQADARGDGEAAGADRRRSTQQIVAAEDQRDERAQGAARAGAGQRPGVRRAPLTGWPRRWAARISETLLAEARTTRTGQDDTIVAQIDDAAPARRGRGRRDARAEGAAEDPGRAAARARRHPVGIQEAALRRSALDLPRGQAGRRPAQRFPARRDHAATYWGHWQRSQNWTPAPDVGRGSRLAQQWPPAGASHG